MLAPVSGPPMSASAITMNPSARRAISPDTRASVETAIPKSIRKNETTISIPSAPTTGGINVRAGDMAERIDSDEDDGPEGE